MKASFHNLGCKVNSYETESMQQLLVAAGYEIVPFEEEADVCIINTCSVTNIADRKSRQMIHKAKKISPDAIIVATGCYAQMFSEDVVKDGFADIIIGNNNKNSLVRLIEEYKKSMEEPIVAVEDLSHGCEYENMISTETVEHTRAFIKIQDGCNQFCSYCIIPFARGRIRSRDMEDIISEAGALGEAGYKELVLTGINLSAYGIDCGSSLIEVIENIAAIPEIKRIRISSLEPGIITEEFLTRLKKVDKICPHFHLSLQSGCDSVLSRMNRHYTTGEYYEKCEMIRKVFELPAITTDIITGFPGETEEEFATTLDFVKRCNIYETHIFKFSRRKGTKADKMPGQLTDKVKSERSTRLSAVAKDNTYGFMEANIGRRVSVLLEEEVTLGGGRYLIGFTKEYVKVGVAAECGALPGDILEGTIKGFINKDTMLLEEI
ncbi:MAG: tRNA (N(6)-L-threonylcarbamoyladenosine(37)-C(2))-methylthiotransferase MtaB [Lachnospiraceae bacterium]|nr:tRNA (N(6)-L-threonylcarbamoyladenosine(37)-C(2))-methylthiotransferase MtaB [Lachnospiraceae bacterium]